MRKKINNIKNTITGFVLFFLTILITSTASIAVFYLISKKTDSTIIIAIAVLGIILVGSLLCTLFDYFRRRKMVADPTQKILDATNKIASGDFSVKLNPRHIYSKFDEYDLIFDNINTMAEELSKNELLKNDFISNVSHEIKTPLSVIQTLAKTLQNKDIKKEQKDKFLQTLISETQKLSSLVSDILLLNKLEHQKMLPEMKDFDLAETLRLCSLSFETLLDKKNIELVCNIDEAHITSSKNLIELVINNLLSNAIKFTEDSGKITVSLHNSGEFVTILVEDTGCGMNEEVGNHIFEKFYQGDTSRASEGNGLGLALVKKVIDLIGGEISVKSELDKGSTFSIKLKKE